MELKTLEGRFAAVEKSLKSKPWFSKGKWIVSQHHFPSKNPDGVTFHVFKKHWFNDEHLGIHFESYIALNPKKLKKSYVTLHLLHYDKVPGLNLPRKKLAQPIVEMIFDEVSKWDGYLFRAGKFGLQPFTKTLDASRADFESALTKELDRLCQTVGPFIDKTLASISSDLAAKH